MNKITALIFTLLLMMISPIGIAGHGGPGGHGHVQGHAYGHYHHGGHHYGHRHHHHHPHRHGHHHYHHHHHHRGPYSTPPGWHHGAKKGWHGQGVPPGLRK